MAEGAVRFCPFRHLESIPLTPQRILEHLLRSKVAGNRQCLGLLGINVVQIFARFQSVCSSDGTRLCGPFGEKTPDMTRLVILAKVQFYKTGLKRQTRLGGALSLTTRIGIQKLRG